MTTSTYRRSRLCTGQRFCGTLVGTLRQVRQETGSLQLGWVLMAEHFPLLIKPQPAAATVASRRELKKRSAPQIIAAPARHQSPPHCDSCPALQGRDRCFLIPQSLSQLTVHRATRTPSPRGRFQEVFRKLLDAHGIAYDERYV